MKYDVFISYCQSDCQIAKELRDALARERIIAFCDTSDLKSGADFASVIVRGIQNAKVFVCLYGKDSPESQWQKHEIEFAIEESMHRDDFLILPVMLSCEVIRDLCRHPVLGRYQMLEYDGEIGQVVNRISHALYPQIEASCNEPLVKQEWFPRGRGPIGSHGPTVISAATPKAMNMYGCSCLVGMIMLAVIGFFIYTMLGRCFSSADTYPSSPDTSSEIPSDSDEIQNDYAYDEGDWAECDTVTEEGITDNPQPSDIGFGENGDLPIQSSAEITEPSDTGFLKYMTGAVFGIILCLSTIVAYNKLRKKKAILKVSSDRNCNLKIDGKKHSVLMASEIEKVQLEQGKYIIDFVADERTSKRFTPTISENGGDDAIVCKFDDDKDLSRRVINCFIAGSTTLDRERDALRATMSIMYNQWKDYNFSILPYTYEDFSMEVTEDGQQSIYDKFITTEADMAVFVFDKNIGPISRREFDKAYDSFKATGRPKILIYSKIHDSYSSEMTDLQKLVNEINQYWIPYKDIEHLKLSFKDYFTWTLMRVYRKELTNVLK